MCPEQGLAHIRCSINIYVIKLLNRPNCLIINTSRGMIVYAREMTLYVIFKLVAFANSEKKKSASSIKSNRSQSVWSQHGIGASFPAWE